MKSNLSCKDKAEATCSVHPTAGDDFRIGGIFNVKCYDNEGNLKWSETKHNYVTDEGINYMLDVMFHGTAATTTWYIGLAGTGTKATTDTLASHSGWSEITAYAGNRKEYVETAASSKSISNTGNAASFTMNNAATVAGAFLASVNTGTSGKLFAVVDFSTPRSVASGDTLNVVYTLSGADS